MKKILILSMLIGQVYTDKETHLKSDPNTEQYNIWYLNRLIFAESSDNPKAVSHKGAIGLMQIMESVRQDHNSFCECKYSYSKKDLYKKRVSLHIGTWQLRRLHKVYSNEIDVVSSYNMGRRYTDDGIYNLDYCFRVLGTNRVREFLRGKKTSSWKGSTRAYYVSEP